MQSLKRYISMLLACAMIMLFSAAIPVAAAEDIPAAGQNFDKYPPLKEWYKDYFLIGTTGSLSGDRSDLINYHYNAYTFENSMKPDNTQRVKGNFTFTSADNDYSNVKATASDMLFVGHTLSWHSQSPNWLWDYPDFDRETAKLNLEEHITAVLERYGANLYAIDVVNEAVGSANPGDWKTAVANKGEGWAQALGWEFVEIAFLKAAEIVDSNDWDCKLYYNEISLDSYAKAQTVYAMVKDINERYAGARKNGKPLIEGIGMQGHYNKNVKFENVDAGVKLFGTLPGVKVSFTEVDMEWLNTGSLTQEDSIKQAQKYAQLFQIFKKYAAGSANTSDNPKVIERVTFWGSDDGSSWKSTNFPLLFNSSGDGQITGKEALVAALYPDEYLEKHPDASSGAGINKHVDGIYVYSTDNGDSWSGANIILGDNVDAWPWSTAGEDGKVAFTPEKDATYRISVNYTPMGTNMIRIRWLRDESNGNYTQGDANAVSQSQSRNSNQIATQIPAYFNSGMINGMAYTLKTEIKLDSAQSSNGLVGNIAIRGGSGGNSFVINWITIEKVGTNGATDEMVANWPDGASSDSAESAAPERTDGVYVYATEDGDNWSGANIILGDNTDAWPWSTAGGDGKVAFTPEKDATYRLSVNYTSKGTSAIRVRWLRDESNGNYTQGDAGAVGESQSRNPDQTATQIPAYFNSGMEQGGTYTLKTEIKLDGSQSADGLIGNIAIRGGSGGNSFIINQIMVEKLGVNGAPDEILVNWPKGISATNAVTTTADANSAITRAEFTAILIDALGLPDNGDGSKIFGDVAKTAKYNGAVGKAYESGIVSGKGAGKFDPDSNILREEAMVMIARAAEASKFTGNIGSTAGYSDAESVDSWAVDSVRFCIGNELLINSNGKIQPKDNVTRTEAEAVVKKLMQIIN